MKEVKQQVKEAAQKQAQDMDAYLMLSFDTFEAKAAFCERFGYDPYSKFIKGEVFDEQVERIDDNESIRRIWRNYRQNRQSVRMHWKLPMPAEFHVNQMKHELSDMSEKLKRIYVEEEGENPWEE